MHHPSIGALAGVDDKAMIRNRFLSQTQTRKGAQIVKTAKYKTSQAESQEDTSFPADGHNAILNKMNKMPAVKGESSNVHAEGPYYSGTVDSSCKTGVYNVCLFIILKSVCSNKSKERKKHSLC